PSTCCFSLCVQRDSNPGSGMIGESHPQLSGIGLGAVHPPLKIVVEIAITLNRHLRFNLACINVLLVSCLDVLCLLRSLSRSVNGEEGENLGRKRANE